MSGLSFVPRSHVRARSFTRPRAQSLTALACAVISAPSQPPSNRAMPQVAVRDLAETYRAPEAPCSAAHLSAVLRAAGTSRA